MPDLILMRSVSRIVCAALLLVLAASAAAAQAGGSSGAGEGGEPAAAREQRMWVRLVGGQRLEADQVTEAADGVWFRRGNLTTFVERARVERIEREGGDEATPARPQITPPAGNWRLADSIKVERFFAEQFKRPLPVTAFGQSALHRRWGFDHRNSLDVGLHPDSPEGRALIKFLRAEGIPFLSFRGAIPGVASGPHIHVGRPSARVATP